MKQKEGISGGEWYEQQAGRAINQAIGRTIRHKRDYGVIVLIDWRYNNRSQNQLRPKWLRNEQTDFTWVKSLTKSIDTFYK